MKMLMLMESSPSSPLPASSEDKTVYSENFSAKSIENSNAISISAGIKSREAKPALLALPASFVNVTASSEDIYFDVSDEKTPSENISNLTNAPAKKEETLLCPAPSETLPSETLPLETLPCPTPSVGTEAAPPALPSPAHCFRPSLE
jgi:hypothetical protein